MYVGSYKTLATSIEVVFLQRERERVSERERGWGGRERKRERGREREIPGAYPNTIALPY